MAYATSGQPTSIGVGVTPIPIFGLLFPARLGEFMVLPVFFRKEPPPSVFFVVVPLMVILVIPVIDAVLRRGDGHDGHWRNKCSGKAE
jgi:hypothetical protein